MNTDLALVDVPTKLCHMVIVGSLIFRGRVSTASIRVRGSMEIGVRLNTTIDGFQFTNLMATAMLEHDLFACQYDAVEQVDATLTQDTV